MGFWGFSLIIVMNFLGLQQHAHAQDGGPHGTGFEKPTTTAPTAAPEQTPVTDASTAASVGTVTVSDTLGPSITASQTLASSSSPSPSPGLGYFPTQWTTTIQDFVLEQIGTAEFLIEAAALGSSPFNVSGTAIYVCQTGASNGEVPTSQNTWAVAQVPLFSGDCSNSTCLTTQVNQTETIKATFQPGTNASSSGLSKLFFCFASEPTYINELVCDSYSPLFNIEPPTTNRRRDLAPRQNLVTPSLMPTIAMSVSMYTPAVSVVGQTPLTTAPAAPTTFTPSGTITPTITPGISATITLVASASRSHGGLSTGAKVGIAMGALVSFAALLLALFLLRRKLRQRSPPPEQVMLTRDMHTDSFSRNALITEKETAAQHTNNLNSASLIDDTLPIQRHSALSPYNSIPAAPYNSPASTVPRRKPTAASAVSRISGPVSPRSVSIPASTPSEEFEEYHDTPMPVYGDARHSPRVYSSEERGVGARAPFLSEEGMTLEEVAKLEEEERRIDAAIAEAERSGR